MNAEIQAKKNEIVKKLGELYKEINFTVSVNRLRPAIAGSATKKTNIITGVVEYSIVLNELYLREHFNTMMVETLPHEICHLYQMTYFPKAKQAHGPEFRMLMQHLGCVGSTYHSMQLSDTVVKKRKLLRYVYEGELTKTKIYIPKQKHLQHQLGLANYVITKTQEKLRFTGETTYI